MNHHVGEDEVSRNEGEVYLGAELMGIHVDCLVNLTGYTQCRKERSLGSRKSRGRIRILRYKPTRVQFSPALVDQPD